MTSAKTTTALRLGALCFFAACGGGASAPAPAPTPAPAPAPAPTPPPPTTSAEPVWIELATDPGLSGLALAPDGALWAVAERGRAAFRFTLDGDRLASLDRVPIDGIPADTDLESIAILSDGRFAFGTESHADGAATLLAGRRATEDGPIVVTPLRDIAKETGISLATNQGVEGLCAAGDTLVLALETVEEVDGVRRAWVISSDLAAGAAPPLVHHVLLTSAEGKLSSLDCAPRAGGGGVDALAIERHFETVRLLAFAVPPAADAAADDADAADAAVLRPTILRDLAAIAGGKNFEGIARLPDGRIALVADNQWKTVDGPSMLLLLPATAPKVAP